MALTRADAAPGPRPVLLPNAPWQPSARACHGSVSSSLTTTDGNGRASVAWTLGLLPGAQQATAAYHGAKGSPVTFTAGATVGPPP
jgi:hypothetical protein